VLNKKREFVQRGLKGLVPMLGLLDRLREALT